MPERIVKIDDTGSTFDYREEIIRCKDCGYYVPRMAEEPFGRCSLHEYRFTKKRGFCDQAEKAK